MENNVVIISAAEYEQLVRDSEKVRILTQTRTLFCIRPWNGNFPSCLPA